MKNLVKVDLGFKIKKDNTSSLNRGFGGFGEKVPLVDTAKFLEVVGNNDDKRLAILNEYIGKFQVFAIDLETLELTAGYTKDNKSYLYEDYYRKFEENQFVDLSENMMYMEYDYLCIWGEKKLWGKLKKEMGSGYTINWEMYPLWGTRKARIVDLLLDE